MPTFLRDEDYQVYLDLMAEWCDERGVDIWDASAVHASAPLALAGDARYAARPGLMPNHVHMIAVPTTEQFRSHERTGRPLGSPAFEDRVERLLCRMLRAQLCAAGRV